MNKTNFISWVAVVVLWLSVGVGCQKDPPEPDPVCKPGCCFGTIGVRFAAPLEGTLIEALGDPVLFEKPVTDLRIPASSCYDKQIVNAFICPLKEEAYFNRLKELSKYPDYKNKRHRVWGVMYEDSTATPPFRPCSKVYYFTFDRIERE
jgi:hypothetical protein